MLSQDVNVVTNTRWDLQFKPKKKADKNNARILVRLLHTGDLPISYLFTKEIDDIRTMIRYSRSLGYRRKIYK